MADHTLYLALMPHLPIFTLVHSKRSQPYPYPIPPPASLNHTMEFSNLVLSPSCMLHRAALLPIKC